MQFYALFRFCLPVKIWYNSNYKNRELFKHIYLLQRGCIAFILSLFSVCMEAFTAVSPSKFGNGAKYNPKKPSWLPWLLISFYPTDKNVWSEALIAYFPRSSSPTDLNSSDSAKKSNVCIGGTQPTLGGKVFPPFSVRKRGACHATNMTNCVTIRAEPFAQFFCQEVVIRKVRSIYLCIFYSKTTRKTYFTATVSTISKA